MKKWIYTALFCMAVFMITACESGREEQKPEGESKASMTVPAQPETESETPSPEAETVSGSEDPAVPPPTGSVQEKEETEMKMNIQIGDTVFTATLAENSSVEALKEWMADGPLTLNMSDYANVEKGADLGVTLPQNNEPMNTQAGDVILYQGRTLVIYYDTNSWSLTPIGKIDQADAEELRTVLGTGDVTVTLSIEESHRTAPADDNAVR